MSVKIQLICADEKGRRAVIIAESDAGWFSVENDRPVHNEDFMVVTLHEISLMSSFVLQRIKIFDPEATEVVKHSHQQITRLRRQNETP